MEPGVYCYAANPLGLRTQRQEGEAVNKGIKEERLEIKEKSREGKKQQQQQQITAGVKWKT